MVTCMICGREFKQITWKHLHFKHGITVEQYRTMGGRTGIEKTCPICDEVFIPGHRKQKTCSPKCGDIHRSQPISGENHPRYGEHFPHTEETKRKISENNAKYWQGKKRPNVGKKISAKLKGRPNLALKGRKFPGRQNSGTFEPGLIPWNKGQTMPPEYGERIRQAMIEKGIIRYGSDNSSWKNGVTPKYMRLRKSKEYQNWRTTVFERDEYTCQSCGQIGGKIVAHHLKRFANYPKLRFKIENGLTMCRPCHSSLHSKGYCDDASLDELVASIKAASWQ